MTAGTRPAAGNGRGRTASDPHRRELSQPLDRLDGRLGDGPSPEPELSLVLPCYNEEDCLELTVPPLAAACREAGVSLELVLVDNGSTDGTAALIDRLIASGLPITKGVVPRNRGQGLGILTGLALCRGRYVGWICADGQVAPEEVVRIYRLLRDAPAPSLAKARRRYRPDGWLRKVVSIGYNALMQLLFPRLPTLDVNGNPKLMPVEVYRALELSSRDWFLEAETMLKAHHLRLPVLEIDVFGRLREGGASHVRLATVVEFARNIVTYRFGGPWRSWQQRVDRRAVSEAVVG